MQIVVMVAGVLVEGAGWWAVSSGRANVWRVMPAVLAGLGLAAVFAGRPVWAGHVGAVPALAAGIATGLGLYAATRAFVWVATGWEPFRLQVVDQYRKVVATPFAEAVVLSLAIMVPAEELFWRGLFQARLAVAFSAAAAAGITWIAYTAANAPSRSLPLLAGALVGGGLWAALAWWSGGMLASLGSHILWTGLMLVVPPGAARADRT
jgi:membrane protease YdiL (CAAX protease family)